MKNVVERVEAGEAVWEWYPIKLSPGPHAPAEIKDVVLEINVMRDAMKIDDVRFCVTPKEQQQIADLIGGIFHTERTQDERHRQATTIIGAVTQIPPGSGKITALAKEEEYSRYVDLVIEKKIGKRNPGLVSTVGKPWTLTKNMSGQQRFGDQTAYNYGWHDSSAVYKSRLSGVKLWQPIISGMSLHVHNWDHKDPSQVCEMPSRDATLVYEDNTRIPIDLASVYTHDLYHHFVTDGDKPLQIVRQSGKLIPEITGKIVLAPMYITA